MASGRIWRFFILAALQFPNCPLLAEGSLPADTAAAANEIRRVVKPLIQVGGRIIVDRVKQGFSILELVVMTSRVVALLRFSNRTEVLVRELRSVTAGTLLTIPLFSTQ